MPRLTRLQTEVMADLASQVRFASRAALLKQIEHAEALAGELKPERAYPEEWLIFRVTGFVPDHGAGRLLTGRQVLSDLSALTEHLCAAAGLHERDDADGVRAELDVEALRARWGVTRRTIERYRREGLVARRLGSDSARGRVRLVFSRSCVESFERRHSITPTPTRARPAAATDRRSAQAEWSAWARRFRQRTGCAWAEVIRRLARRTGRSTSTIRRALRAEIVADDSTSARGASARRGQPMRARERRVAVRAVRAGVALPTIARRYGRKTPAVARTIVLGRLEMLSAWDLPRDAAAARLDDPSLQSALLRDDDAPWPRDADGLREIVVSAGAGESPMRADTERALATAHALLLRVAGGLAHAAAQRDQPPSAAWVDDAETALRWASRLRRRLLRAALPLLARTLKERAASSDAALVVRCVSATATAIHGWSPERGGRLAAPVSLALARELAAPRAIGTGIAVGTASPVIAPWDAPLSMPPWVACGVDGLSAPRRAAVEARFGTPEQPPMTMLQIKVAFGLSAPGWWSAYRLAARLGSAAAPPQRAAAKSPRARRR
ncbi:MAG: hypothetical protein ACKVZJ_13410 [Phycisphaerales bacterium]